jgi:hypothetical protein
VANGNGNVVKALGVAGLVIGVVGGSFGLSSSVGPGQRIDEHERRLVKTEDRVDSLSEGLTRFEARQTEANRAVNEKLDKLLKAAGL